MEPSLRDFAKGLTDVPKFGTIKLVRFLRREGFLKKGSYINEPTEKAEGLLDVRRVYTDEGNSYRQVFVTEEGVQVFTDMIKAEYEDFGPWEIRSNYHD